MKPSPTIFMAVLDERASRPRPRSWWATPSRTTSRAPALGMRAYLVDREGRTEVEDAIPTLLALPALIGIEADA